MELAKINRIVFVAKSGNSRAPMAAEILRELIRGMGKEVVARGLVVLFSEPMNQKAEAVMISNGYDVSGFMSSQLSEEDFTEDTLVVTLEASVREKILDKFPNVNEDNVQILTEIVGDELEIMDPYGGTLQLYGLCYESLSQSIGRFASMLKEQ